MLRADLPANIFPYTKLLRSMVLSSVFRLAPPLFAKGPALACLLEITYAAIC